VLFHFNSNKVVDEKNTYIATAVYLLCVLGKSTNHCS